jgi:predicted nucleic acid-binding protein
VAIFYADASALVKLVREEPESSALRTYLTDADVVSSDLVLTEIPRAVRRAVAYDPELPLARLLEQAGALIDAIALRPLDRALLAGAGALTEPALRALDAVHVASAVGLHPIDAFVTYDERQAAAARLAGLRTVAPGRSGRC